VKKNPPLRATLQALVYADYFSFPLTKEELWQRLICPPLISKRRWEKNLVRWVKEGKLATDGDYYFLPGREKNVWKRRRGEAVWRQKWPLVQKAARWLAKIPSVWLVALTGNLAAGVARPADDIDLMIITAPQTLWLTRFLIYLILSLARLPVRRPGEPEVANKLCLNLFLDAADLRLEPKWHNLFVAHEIVLLRPLVNKRKIYQSFLAANLWARKFLPYGLPYGLPCGLPKKKKRFFSPPFPSSLLNRFCFKLQRLYMQGKPPATKISLTQAFFHPQDASRKILRCWQERCKRKGLF